MGCSASVHNKHNDTIHPQSASGTASPRTEEPSWTGVGVVEQSNRRAEGGSGTKPQQSGATAAAVGEQGRGSPRVESGRQTRVVIGSPAEGPGRVVSFDNEHSDRPGGAEGGGSDSYPASPPKPAKSHTMPYIEVADDPDRSANLATSTETAPYLSSSDAPVVVASEPHPRHRSSAEASSDAPLVHLSEGGLDHSTGDRPPMLPTTTSGVAATSQVGEQRSQGGGMTVAQVGSWSADDMPMPSPNPNSGPRYSMTGALMSNRSDSPAYNFSMQDQSWKMPPGASGVSYGNLTSASVNSGFSTAEPPPAFWAQYFEKNSRAVAQALKDLESGLPNGGIQSLTGSQRQKIEGWVAETPSPPPVGVPASGVPPLAPHTNHASTAVAGQA
jgi:hypothetical protein